MRHSALIAIAAAALLSATADAQVLTYVDSSSRDRLEGKFDMSLAGSAASLDADMKVASRNGETRFMPRITSSWAPVSRVDVRAIVLAGDLNDETASGSVDTRLALRPAAPFVDRVETSLMRGAGRSRESLAVSFASFDTGLELFGGEALRFDTDLKHERRGESAVTTSNLSSSVGLGDAVSLLSSVELDDSTGAGMRRAVIDTRLVYRTPLPFVKRIEGYVRTGDGSRERLTLTLPEIAGASSDGSSYQLTSKVLIQEIALDGGTESRRIGFESKLSGLFASPIGGRNSLSLDLERGLGSEELRSASLSYNHEWTPTEQGQLALKLRTTRHGETVEPWMDINWSARF